MPRCLRRANKSAPTAVLHVAVAPKSAQVEVSVTTQDIVFLSRAMGTPVPAVVDPSKWFDAAMANPARRAAGIAHIDALLGQLPTEEDAARTPVESERRDALPERPVWTEDGCPCESGKDFGECHGADGTKTPVPGHEEALAEIAFLKRREAEFIAALSPVCDGGQYRADVVTRIQDVLRERDEAVKGRAAERAAWKRLVDATETLWMGAMDVAASVAAGEKKRTRDLAPERDAVAAAKAALKALGVDVDAMEAT